MQLRIAIPPAMQQARRCLVWRAIPKDGRIVKQPFYVSGQARHGKLDGLEDLAALATFDQALKVSGTYTGLGFALGPDETGNVWQGIDLDHIDERPELAALGETLSGYVERSPSGTGLHAIGYGKAFKSLGSNTTGIEAYTKGRYFTVTGEAIGGDIEDVAAFVDGTLTPLHHPEAKPAPEPAPPARESFTDTDARTQADLRSALASMRSDDRDLWVRMGLALKTIGDVGRGLWFEWSQTSAKYDAADAARVWESFQPDGTDFKAVFVEATRAGWVNPAKRTHAPENSSAKESNNPSDPSDTWDEYLRDSSGSGGVVPRLPDL